MKSTVEWTVTVLGGLVGLAVLAGLVIVLGGPVGLVFPAGPAARFSGPATPQPTLAAVAPTATMPPTPIALPSPTTSAPAFTPATYTDDKAGVAVDYPEEWTLDDSGAGARGQRGYSVQLTSWAHAPGDVSAQTPAGGSRMDITIYQWDPKNDLDAFVASRETAWASSGFTFTAKDTWMLAGDLAAVRFLVQTPDEEAFFLMTTAHDRYLILSGTGDLSLLDAIGRTTRLVAAP